MRGEGPRVIATVGGKPLFFHSNNSPKLPQGKFGETIDKRSAMASNTPQNWFDRTEKRLKRSIQKRILKISRYIVEMATFFGDDDKHQWQLFSALSRKNGIQFDNVVSIGGHCATSSTLKKMGLKQWSGPFDWVFSDIAVITHCICDDFNIFLDKKHHRHVPRAERLHKRVNVCDHEYYRIQYGISFMFNHYDITDDSVYEYYTRCVNRFRQSLCEPNQTLLVGIYADASQRQFLALCKAVERYPAATLLIIHAKHSGWSEFGATLVAAHGRHQFYEMNMIGDIGPVNFENGYDEVLFQALIDARLHNIEDSRTIELKNLDEALFSEK